MSRKPPSFFHLDKAFWAWVERQCPYSVQSRHRYTWVRQNQRFRHGGVEYERSSRTLAADGSARGLASVLVSYVGSDGSLIEHCNAASSLVPMA